MSTTSVNIGDEPILLTRDETCLAEVRGKSVPFNGSSDECFPSKPFMKTTNDEIDDTFLFGRKSGLRSAIINAKTSKTNKKELVFIKGCGYEDKGIDPTEEHAGQPMGGQLKSCAIQELESTEKINKLLKSTGFKPVRIPLGRFDYAGIEFDGEPCSAGIFKTNGDTRLDEFFNYLMAYTLAPENMHRRYQLMVNIEDVFSRVARYCGNLIQVLYSNGYLWGSSLYDDGTFMSNAHIGNFVIFPDNRNRCSFGIGIVDFDSQNTDGSNIKSKKDLLKLQRLEVDNLVSSFALGQPISNSGYSVKADGREGMPLELVELFSSNFSSGFVGALRPELICFDAFGLLHEVATLITSKYTMTKREESSYDIKYINNYFIKNNIYNYYSKKDDNIKNLKSYLFDDKMFYNKFNEI